MDAETKKKMRKLICERTKKAVFETGKVLITDCDGEQVRCGHCDRTVQLIENLTG